MCVCKDNTNNKVKPIMYYTNSISYTSVIYITYVRTVYVQRGND